MDGALVAALYDSTGPFRGVSIRGMAAWAAGAAVFFAANHWTAIGGTVPALATSVVVYTVSAALPPDTRHP